MEGEVNIRTLGGQYKHSSIEHGEMQSNKHGSLGGSKVKSNDDGGTE
jgi:hypothetical protein